MNKTASKLIHNFLSAICSRDPEKIASYCSEDCVYESVAIGGVMYGRQAIQAGFCQLFASIPDFKLELLSVFISGKQVGSEWVMTGTPITGVRFSNRGASISELQGGRIKRNTDYFDPASFLQATHKVDQLTFAKFDL